MTPSFYIRPNRRTGGTDGTSGDGVVPNFFAPRLHHWPWVKNGVSIGDVHYFLGPAEFPLQDHALPPKMWDFFRVKEWRLTGVFTDATYDPENDVPNMSRTMSYVFGAGTVTEQGWLTPGNEAFSNSYGTNWASVDEAIRSNGIVEGAEAYGLTAGLFRQEQEIYTNEAEETEYYYASLGIGIGQPVLYRPLTPEDVPVGGTLGEWGWVLPIRGAFIYLGVGSTVFATVDADQGQGSKLTFNGEEITISEEDDDGNWEISLTEESYYE